MSHESSRESSGDGGDRGESRRKRPTPLQVSGADRDLTARARERWRDPTDWRRIIEMSLVLWDAAPESVEAWLQQMGRQRDQGEVDQDRIWAMFVEVIRKAESSEP